MSKDTESQHSEASPQHTPGPWHVVHGLYPEGEVEVQGGGANLTGPIANLANANLIAAAPDLAALLEKAVRAEYRETYMAWDPAQRPDWCKEAEALLVRLGVKP